MFGRFDPMIGYNMSDIFESFDPEFGSVQSMQNKEFEPSFADTQETPDPEGFLSFEALWQADSEDAAGTLDPMQALRDKQEQIECLSEEMVERAKNEADGITKQAWEKGLAEGKEEAGKIVREEFKEKFCQLDALLREIQGQRAALNKQYEEDLQPLIKAMVDRLVNHEVSVNKNVILTCLRKTLDFVVENTNVKVLLHPDDFNRIKEASLENPELFEGMKKIQLAEDPEISVGGCLLDTEFGEVDATLEKRRENLYKAVDKAFYSSLAEDM